MSHNMLTCYNVMQSQSQQTELASSNDCIFLQQEDEVDLMINLVLREELTA